MAKRCGSFCVTKKCKRIRSCVCKCNDSLNLSPNGKFWNSASQIHSDCVEECHSTDGKLSHTEFFCNKGSQFIYNNVPDQYHAIVNKYDCEFSNFEDAEKGADIIQKRLKQNDTERAEQIRQIGSIAAALLFFLFVFMIIKSWK